MIAVIDYGMGNLASVKNAFLKTGFPGTVVTSDPDEIRGAEKLVLPGVGAFEDAIDNLKRQGLIDPILDHVKSGRPFLGICLGFQLMFSKGYENGVFDGLGIFSGKVIRFEIDLPVPHMGWNTAMFDHKSGAFAAMENGDYFYFDHSYHAVPDDSAIIAARSEYGMPFVAAIQKGMIFGTQFHPEKSHDRGLCIIRDFASL